MTDIRGETAFIQMKRDGMRAKAWYNKSLVKVQHLPREDVQFRLFIVGISNYEDESLCNSGEAWLTREAAKALRDRLDDLLGASE